MILDTILSTISYSIWSLTSIFSMVPIPKDNITITYTLYIPNQPNPTTISNITDLEINADFDLKILCHGWTDDKHELDWFNSTVNEYLKKGGTNVITVDYSGSMNGALILTGIKSAKQIGQQVGEFILELHENKGIAFSKVHILGHLTGAHAAGVAGETIYKETGKYIDRISGLDPTIFGFFQFFSDGRLSRHDAKFVDVIHTSSLGYFDPIGMIDFFGYPFMTNCTKKWYHSKPMAPVYYSNSINNVEVMLGTKCVKRRFFFSWTKCNQNVTAVLGEHVDREQYGKFYLDKAQISKYIC